MHLHTFAAAFFLPFTRQLFFEYFQNARAEIEVQTARKYPQNERKSPQTDANKKRGTNANSQGTPVFQKNYFDPENVCL